MKRAAAEHRLLLLKVGTEWCSACRKLESELARPSVAKALSEYLRLSYDAEQGEGESVARRYNVVTFPTLVVVAEDAREVDRVTGFLESKALLERIAAIRSGSETLEKLTERADANPPDVDLQLRVGTAWAARGETAPARRLLGRAAAPGRVAGADATARERAARALLARGKLLELRSHRDFAAARATLEDLRKRYAGTEEADAAVYPLARALHGLGRTTAALALLRREARDEDGHARLAWFCLFEGTATELGITHARRAAELSPKDAEILGTLGALLERAGKTKDAAAAFAKAVSLDAKNQRYVNAVKRRSRRWRQQ